jgi:hypothetical protein
VSLFVRHSWDMDGWMDETDMDGCGIMTNAFYSQTGSTELRDLLEGPVDEELMARGVPMRQVRLRVPPSALMYSTLSLNQSNQHRILRQASFLWICILVVPQHHHVLLSLI